MLKTGIKVLATMTSCALCASLAGGVAYASAPAEAAEPQAATEAAKAEATDSVASAYGTSANLLGAAGLDENGNPIEVAAPETQATVDAAAVSEPAAPAETAAVTEAAPAVEQATAPAPPPAPEPVQQSLYPMSLRILGEVIPYIDYFGASSAPDSTGGLWMGSDSTTDGDWGYFIGHHPGIFNCVMDLTVGDQVSVCDRNGNTATYTVFDVYDIPNTTYFEDLEPYIEGHGESIVLQTCYGDGYTYRIVQAA